MPGIRPAELLADQAHHVVVRQADRLAGDVVQPVGLEKASCLGLTTLKLFDSGDVGDVPGAELEGPWALLLDPRPPIVPGARRAMLGLVGIEDLERDLVGSGGYELEQLVEQLGQPIACVGVCLSSCRRRAASDSCAAGEVSIDLRDPLLRRDDPRRLWPGRARRAASVWSSDRRAFGT